MEYTNEYVSPLGKILLASDGHALTGLWFEGQKYFAAKLDPDHEEKKLPVFARTAEWLALYFDGEKPAFIPPLTLKGTPFQKEVWEILLQIFTFRIHLPAFTCRCSCCVLGRTCAAYSIYVHRFSFPAHNSVIYIVEIMEDVFCQVRADIIDA